MTLRISGGVAKGRRIGFQKAFLRGSEDDELRPTSSKVREALFDILRNVLPGASFLDLYAGTGGVGIEALSRGAARVVFVEPNTVRVRIINRLVSEFQLKDRSKVIKGKALDYVTRGALRDQGFDIIFLDPPYQSGELMKVLPSIGKGKILREGGTVIAEHFFKTDLPDEINTLRMVKHYHYGDTVLTLYRRSATQGENRT